MDELRVTTCMAPGMDEFCRDVTQYLAACLGHSFQFVVDLSWPERYWQLDAGIIQIGWICGAPYVVRRRQQTLALLAAPVWRGAPYADRPVYFSDIIVHETNPAEQFIDLRGQRWVYNEAGSLSGYHVLRAHLATLGEGQPFFAESIEAGYHWRALEMIRTGQADVAAIDTTVFAQIAEEQPTLVASVRSLGRLGPNPAPPWVIQTTVSVAIRHEIRRLLLAMAEDEAGAALLAASPIARFARVDDADYDSVAAMLTQSASLELASLRQLIRSAPLATI
jgi:phosphonate transport system substrate-binding protein